MLCLKLSWEEISQFSHIKPKSSPIAPCVPTMTYSLWELCLVRWYTDSKQLFTAKYSLILTREKIFKYIKIPTCTFVLPKVLVGPSLSHTSEDSFWGGVFIPVFFLCFFHLNHSNWIPSQIAELSMVVGKT